LYIHGSFQMVTYIPAGNLKMMVTDGYVVSKGNVNP
jgi:hypothetical protein